MSLIAIKNNEKALIIFDSVLSLIIIIVLSVFYKKIVKKKKQAIFKSLLLAIGMFLFSIILNLLFSRIPTPENQHYINEVRNVAPVLMALHTRLFSPIIEELLTRGIFMNLFFIKNTSRSVLCKIFFLVFFFVLAMDYYHQFPCFFIVEWAGF
ncbi:CPBP family intramembrane glutamic endopeptidase [Enterococcus faecalis]